MARDLHRPDDIVAVSDTELVRGRGGCSDIETVIGITRPDEGTETIRIHGAVAKVTRDERGSRRRRPPCSLGGIRPRAIAPLTGVAALCSGEADAGGPARAAWR